MPRRRRKRNLYALSAELAVAVPQVMAHRLLRMASAGEKPSVRDRREFDRMIREKAAALCDSWVEMAWKSLEVNQRLALSVTRSWLIGSPTAVGHAKRVQRAGLEVLAAGLTPVHRQVTANARRLNRRRPRR
jgi:hypothetical protein